jgi:hypothetical protein
MSKPRIRLIGARLWECSQDGYIGNGYGTIPRDAYNWFRLNSIPLSDKERLAEIFDKARVGYTFSYDLASQEARDYTSYMKTDPSVMTIFKFLWIPKKVEGKWRWLCSVTAHMRKVKRTSMPPEGIGSFEYEDWIVEEYKL